MVGLVEKKPKGNWVQTERAAHEAWGQLIDKSPKAAQLMHILTARVGEHNAVVVSQKTLSSLMRCSRRTVQRSLDVLVEDRWIETRQLGDTGTVNAHIINDRVAWSGKREGIRYSLFSAAVIVSEEEQPDRADLGNQEPLRRLPSLFRDERQLPSGDGLPPPSEPSLPGMEHELPALSHEDEVPTVGNLAGKFLERFGEE
jgi:DNA-binding transcriptional MocR family regulator